jgi:hypothetical protein
LLVDEVEGCGGKLGREGFVWAEELIFEIVAGKKYESKKEKKR